MEEKHTRGSEEPRGARELSDSCNEFRKKGEAGTAERREMVAKHVPE